MAKRIIILGSSIQGDNVFLNCVFWFPITSGQLARTTGSAWTGASVEENQAIESGNVLEEMQSYPAPRGTDSSVVEALLLQLWTNRNTELGGKGPASFEGIFNDSDTGWNNTPVTL